MHADVDPNKQRVDLRARKTTSVELRSKTTPAPGPELKRCRTQFPLQNIEPDLIPPSLLGIYATARARPIRNSKNRLKKSIKVSK